MLDKLPIIELPAWLLAVAENPEHATRCTFCLESVLRDSLFYPACGFNGTPVKFLAGNILSFVYADYRIERAEFLQHLNGDGEDCGFRGYQSIMQRELTPGEIDLEETAAPRREFAHWSVWKRDPNRGSDYGPQIFSFLYLEWEAAAAYGLYSCLGIAPRILTIIQPGCGSDGDSRNLKQESSNFHAVVRGEGAIMPQYLLNGGFGSPENYNEPCWAEYRGNVLCRLPERAAGLWQLKHWSRVRDC